MAISPDSGIEGDSENRRYSSRRLVFDPGEFSPAKEMARTETGGTDTQTDCNSNWSKGSQLPFPHSPEEDSHLPEEESFP